MSWVLLLLPFFALLGLRYLVLRGAELRSTQRQLEALLCRRTTLNRRPQAEREAVLKEALEQVEAQISALRRIEAVQKRGEIFEEEKQQ